MTLPNKYLSRSKTGIVPVKTSPFMAKFITKIPLSNKAVAYATNRTEMIDAQTGEVETVTWVKREAVDKDHFLKFYDQGLQLFNLNGSARKVLLSLLTIYRDNKRNFTDEIYVNFRIAKESANYPHKITSWMNGINRLIQSEVIAPCVDPNIYFINPDFFFKGNRLRLVQEYVQAKRLDEIALTP